MEAEKIPVMQSGKHNGANLSDIVENDSVCVEELRRPKKQPKHVVGVLASINGRCVWKLEADEQDKECLRRKAEEAPIQRN